MVPPKQYKWDEIVDRALRGIFGDDKGVDYFIKHGSSWANRSLPLKEQYNYYYYPGHKTKHPICVMKQQLSGEMLKKNCDKAGVTPPGWDMDEFMWHWQAMPQWKPHSEHTASKEFDLFAVNWKNATRPLDVGGVSEFDTLRELHEKYHPEIDVILMNKNTSAQKNLKDGDRIEVESQYGGKVQGVLATTGLLHPESVGFAGNFGHRAPLMGKGAQRGVNYNQLLDAADGNYDPVLGGIEITAAVKVKTI